MYVVGLRGAVLHSMTSLGFIEIRLDVMEAVEYEQNLTDLGQWGEERTAFLLRRIIE